jgi:hypothetical protein
MLGTFLNPILHNAGPRATSRTSALYARHVRSDL